MNRPLKKSGTLCCAVSLVLALGPFASYAQVPADDSAYVSDSAEPAALRSASELKRLVGPIALYPDDLLAVVLPASTYPLQVVQAQRFLDDLEQDPSLTPDDGWDESIVALVNYPEVVALLNEDLDWTWQLGEAVVAQQSDVLNAVEEFRNQAYAAGNLKSDEYQTVTQSSDDVIEIRPVSEEVIYVPYYEPERVVVYQPQPVYNYYPRPCPVYYYPYPAGYAFSSGYFWGVTTAFTIGWGWGWGPSYLRVYHPSYYGHPYYGNHYVNNWYYRRASIAAYNNVYINNRTVVNNYTNGDAWRASSGARLRSSDQRISRERYYPNGGTAMRSGNAHARTSGSADSVRDMHSSMRSNREQRVRDGQRVIPRDNIVVSRTNAVVPRDNMVVSRDNAVVPRSNPVAQGTRLVTERPEAANTRQRNARNVQRTAPGSEQRTAPGPAQRSAPGPAQRTAPVAQQRATSRTNNSTSPAQQRSTSGASRSTTRAAQATRPSSGRHASSSRSQRTH
jgi:hypothetical protein